MYVVFFFTYPIVVAIQGEKAYANTNIPNLQYKHT